MPEFIITAKAGRMVAGRNNRGVGTVLTDLDEYAAAEAVARGELAAYGVAMPEAAPEPGGTGAETPAKGGKAGKAAKAPSGPEKGAGGDA